jgi:hypothetical protein
MRNEISRAGFSAEPDVLCALRDLREHGCEAHRSGTCTRCYFDVLADAGNSSVAMRAVPAQVFLGAADAKGRTGSGANGGLMGAAM